MREVGPAETGIVMRDESGLEVGVTGVVGSLFEPGDDVGRAWEEAEAVLTACDDLGAVMATIRDAASPVEARRELKQGFGFTGRQAALLLTMPVMAFTRSERERLESHRRARTEMLADVTGVLPVIREHPPVRQTVSSAPDCPPATPPVTPPAAPLEPSPEPAGMDWAADLDRVLDRLMSSMDDPWRVDDVPTPSAPSAATPSGERPGPRSARRSVNGYQDAASVLDEQIGELCDGIAALVGAEPPEAGFSGAAVSDDPRDPGSPSGALLDSCGVDDTTGVRTLLWHLRRTGLDAVEGLFPFAEALSVGRGIDEQAVRFEQAMASGQLGSEPGGDAAWAGRLWPIAQRSGFGYAVSYREGPDVGSVWAYGGGEPLHRLWDSVIDLLAELYQALTTGSPCDAALAAATRGRVVWTNLG